MTNPLEQPRPDDLVSQIHDYARDLAYGAVNGLWGAQFVYSTASGWVEDPREIHQASDNHRAFYKKWPKAGRHNDSAPSFMLLTAYDYMRQANVRPAQVGQMYDYVLTPKAFALLEKPVASPQIFISYRRNESSAFALLIEARLRIAGADNIFIDKSIPIGEDWHDRLQTMVRNCKYFILLVGPQTLSSEWVQAEINWAAEAGCTIVSVWHSGARMSDSTPEVLRRRQAITIGGDSAKDYESAVSELLNGLGYRTY